MMRLRGGLGNFGALAVCSFSCAASALPPGNSVQLSKVILNTETQIKGKTKVGTVCLFGGGKLTLSQDQKTLNLEHYENLFTKRLTQDGYSVVANSSDLFADAQTAKKGEMLVGATLRPDTINLCSSVSGEKGDIILAVDWKIFDRSKQKVVASVSTTGFGKQEKFAVDGLTRMLDEAFVANLGSLLDDKAVQEQIGTPSASPSAL